MFQQTMSERKAEKPFSFLNSFLYFFGFVSIFQFCCWTQCQLPILAPVTPSSAVMALLLLIQGDNHHHHHLHCHDPPLITWRISVIGGLSIIMLMIMIIHPPCTTGYLEDIWEGWSQLWDQEPLGCWLDTSRYACLHVCIYYNTSKYEDHEDHEDGEDDDYNDNYQNHATSLTWQLCQGFETACKNSSVISCTTFREPLRADHRLRSKMNLKSGPIWLEIWNLALFCLKSDCLTAQNFIMATNPDLLRTLGWSRSKHHLNYFPM